MENIPPHDLIAAAATVAAALIAAMTLFLNHYLNLKKHHIDKKNRLLEFSKTLNNKYPSNQVDEGYLRHLIYDFCDGKHACAKLFVLCLNRPDTDKAVESFKVSGHLFYYCTNTLEVIRIKGKRWHDTTKAILMFACYVTLTISIWVMTVILPRYIELETRTQKYTLAFIIGFLMALTIYSMFSLGMNGKRFRANYKLAKILEIKNTDLPF